MMSLPHINELTIGPFLLQGSLTLVLSGMVRALLPSSLSAQIKWERLTIGPGTADGFRSTFSSLRSIDGSKGVIFLIFNIPEDSCVRLLVKILGRQMPESVVRE